MADRDARALIVLVCALIFAVAWIARRQDNALSERIDELCALIPECAAPEGDTDGR